MAVGLTAVVGCGKARTRVAGTVTINGSPMDRGVIAFDPLDPSLGPKVGGKIMDGAYELDPTRGPFPGKYRVEIRWMKATGKKFKNDDGGIEEVRVEGLPAKYHDESELTAEIGGWGNKLDFDVTP
jgi:hypothetical protein